mmetsp:Transcript_43609/g.123431  ORF Transcript_43609/g.123431 Transcript_43609/m.123431 type:complete len:673 (-) Transcript_43609:58-2076(-)
MQPFVYLVFRILVGWLQYLERHNRAFAVNAPIVLAAGAAHSWAVVYALFIAVIARAVRLPENYGRATADIVPLWVLSVERVAVVSMGVWWCAGIIAGILRLLDDEAQCLPVERRDVRLAQLFSLARLPALHAVSVILQMLSCLGLFISIGLLCFALLVMKGDLVLCEFCLLILAGGFSLSHAAVGIQRMLPKSEKEMRFGHAALSMAMESAALGPQLCTLLALACVRVEGTHRLQNFTYGATAVAFLAALVACAHAPRNPRGANLPPTISELAFCAALDVAAAAALLAHFPQLWSWLLGGLLLILASAGGILSIVDIREPILQVLEPVIPIQSSSACPLPSQRREGLRGLSRWVAVVCAAAALWGVVQHPARFYEPGQEETPPDWQDGVQHYDNMRDEEYAYPGSEGFGGHEEVDVWGGEDDSRHETYDDFWSDHWLLLRWRPRPQEEPHPEEHRLLTAAADALGADAGDFSNVVLLHEHRLVLFRYVGSNRDHEPPLVPERWRAALDNPSDDLAQLVGGNESGGDTFPAALDIDLCRDVLVLHEEDNMGATTTTTSPTGDAAPAGADELEVTTSVAYDDMEEADRAHYDYKKHQAEERARVLGQLGQIGDTAAQASYRAACEAWDQQLHNYYNYGEENWEDEEGYRGPEAVEEGAHEEQASGDAGTVSEEV